ncbi:MAG: ThiF family adenylyltransferase [Bryobacterales bacterium]|nr:ThiF family adenylyltransferase [Bryobacterales bacterium]
MNDSQRERYSRQVLFGGIGEAGQQRLVDARVTIVGCGALGSFHAAALVRAGVGRIRLIDRDFVEWSNLQRQWLFEESDAREALPKAVAAARKAAQINSSVIVESVVDDLNPQNAEDLLSDADLLLDGTDNFDTRYLINDFSVERGVPWIYGGAVGSYGIVMPVLPGRGPCFECIYPNPPQGAQPTCETAGVLNTVTASVAAWQASLAMKFLVSGGMPPFLTTMDLWAGTAHQVRLPDAHPDCPACGKRTCRHLHGKERIPISLCGRNAVQIHDRRRPVDLRELRQRLAPLGETRANEFAVRFHHESYEMTIFADGRAIIKGTTDPGIARSLYSRFIGN